MRQLILHRQRALACFALRYHCILNQERDAFLEALARQEPLALMERSTGPVLRNGETISIDIDQGENTFFVAVYLEKKQIVTAPVVIEPGTEDVRYQIVTEFNGADRMSLTVLPVPRAD